MRRRTKKEFVNYNDYEDRSFGLKWGTAFALDELKKVIDDNKNDAMDTGKKLPQMTQAEIDDVLQIAFLKTKSVSIQLNLYDDKDRLYPTIEGVFSGYADCENLYIEDQDIAWEIIRNIQIKE
ncbi:hypothetical protein [Erysipelothrix urinaevulpis]|uniref:hypothetical protein n=1 Tax=Erysipelothrix urinaevulpis TaxID=2683717 RepID=UPI001F372402|nr:hypothetical protein [Erysipelothrix urinaevulpis]